MRRYRASRLTRVLALFAWLMLVMTSLPVAAMGATDGPMYDATPPAMSSMTGHGLHHATQAGDCCGHPAHSTCHCGAMCGNVLLPAMPDLLGCNAPDAGYAMFHDVDAPTLDTAPPLRPPAA
jgi:hypothetical protein